MSSLPALPPSPPSQSSFLVLPPSPPQTGESSLLHNPEVCSVLQSLVSQEGRGEVADPYYFEEVNIVAGTALFTDWPGREGKRFSEHGGGLYDRES